jgi:PAS domain S-box-containing protein
MGIPIYKEITDALRIKNIEFVIEVTGSEEILKEIHDIFPKGVRIIDHNFAQLFWELTYGLRKQQRQLQKLEALDQRFINFINSALDWISIKNLDGEYLTVNKSCANAFGKNPDEFIGKKPEELFPADQAKIIKIHDQEVIERKLYKKFDEIKTIDGRDRHFRTIRFPLTDYKGNVTGVCNIGRDITSEIVLQEQLVQTAKLAALGQLAAGVAHEINNPLTGILSYAEDLVEDFNETDQKFKDLHVIIKETLRCRDIVRNLLDFARQDKLNLAKVSPSSIIHQTLSLVKKLPQFINIEIEEKPSQSIPKINCDVHQLQQVVLNLMVNASDAMNGTGKIIIGTQYIPQQEKCVLFVEDNGPGIPENMVDKIFEPFFSSKGTNGLGLAVSWGIVERHKGIIEVDTADSGGAIFRIILPAGD